MYKLEDKKPKDDFTAGDQPEQDREDDQPKDDQEDNQPKNAGIEEYADAIFKFAMEDLKLRAILALAASISEELKFEIKNNKKEHIILLMRALYNSWVFSLNSKLQLALKDNMELDFRLVHDFLKEYDFHKICELLSNKINECVDAALKEHNSNADQMEELSTTIQEILSPAFEGKNNFEDILKLSLGHDSNRIFKGIDTEPFNNAFNTCVKRYFTRYALGKTLTNSVLELRLRDAKHFLSELSTPDDVKVLLQPVLDEKYKERCLFHLICEKTNTEVTSIALQLLVSKYLISLLPKPSTPWNPVGLDVLDAAKKGDVETIKLYEELGVNIHRTTKTTKRNALHYAAKYGQEETLWYLMSRGFNPLETDASEKSLLMIAVTNPKNDIRFIQCLIDQLLLDPKTTDNMGRNALHLAVLEGCNEVVQLLRHYIDVNSQGIDGNTPLHLAIAHNELELEKIVALIFEPNIDLFIKNKEGVSPIDLIKEKNNPKLNEILLSALKRETTINYETMVDQANKIRAINEENKNKNNQAEIPKWQPSHRKDSFVATKNPAKSTPNLDSTINSLIEGISKKDLTNAMSHLAEILKYPEILLDKFATHSNFYPTRYRGYCVFHAICEAPIPNLASIALKTIVDNSLFSSLVTEPRPKNWEPKGLELLFIKAAKEGEIETIKRCGALGIPIDFKTYPVKPASEESGKPLSKKLVKGKSGLHYAAENGQKNAVQYFIAEGLSPFEQDPTGKTILSLAVQGEVKNNTDPHFIKYLLLDIALNPNDTDENNRNALHLAAIEGSYSTAELLCQYGVDVNHKDLQGNTPLHCAIAKDRPLELIQLLLDWGAVTDTPNKNGETPKTLAKKKKNKELNNLFSSEIKPMEEAAKAIEIYKRQITAYKEVIEQQKREIEKNSNTNNKEESEKEKVKEQSKEKEKEKEQGKGKEKENFDSGKKLLIGRGRSNTSSIPKLDDKKFNIIQKEDKIYITLKSPNKKQGILSDPILSDLEKFLRENSIFHEGFTTIENGYCVHIRKENQDKLINMLGLSNSSDMSYRSLSFS